MISKARPTEVTVNKDAKPGAVVKARVDDFFVIIPGCHWVNRESYFITEIPVQKEDLQTEFLVIE